MPSCRAITLVVALLMAASCGRKNAQSTHKQPADKREQTQLGSVEIRVTPPEGISVWLDNERIAQRSPCEAVGVTPGTHLLEVRAMGYHTVTLPLSLHPGEKLRVPVALRSRAPRPFDSPPVSPPVAPAPLPGGPAAAQRGPSPKAPAAGTIQPQAGDTQAPPAAPASPRAPAPRAHRRGAVAEMHEVASVWLAVVPQPPAAIVVDGQVVSGDAVHLTRAQGTLSIGRLQVTYTLLPGQVAALTIPHDRAVWYAGPAQIKAKSVVRVGRLPVALRRVAHGAENNQEAVLRRLL